MNFHTMHHPFNLILICNYINWACTIKSHRIILINFLNQIFGHFVVSIMLMINEMMNLILIKKILFIFTWVLLKSVGGKVWLAALKSVN